MALDVGEFAPHVGHSVVREAGNVVEHPQSSPVHLVASHHGSQAAASSSRSSMPNVPPAPSVPPFALGILASLPPAYQVNPVKIVQGILVRSWLLHHVTFPRSLHPRKCMLRGPPHTWRAQLIAVWFGATVPQEEPSIDLVKPAPPRNWHESSILFDVVLAQGLESGRIAGLVTILPTFQHAVLSMYSVAVSFDPLISGQDVVTQSDIQDVCNLHDCLIFHAAIHFAISRYPPVPDSWFM